MPETIGQQLKSAREARNLSLEKVTQVTHIKERLLEAMEADDFESLPSPVQARAFLRLYAGFLGLSLDEMIARQRQSAGEPAPDLLSDDQFRAWGSAPDTNPTAPEVAELDGEGAGVNSFQIMENDQETVPAPQKTFTSARGILRKDEPNLPSQP